MSNVKTNLKNFIKDSREAAAKAVIKVFHGDLASNEKKNAGNPFFETCVKEHDKELEDWKNPYGYWLRSDAWEKRVGSLSDDEGKITFGEYEYVYLCIESAIPARGWKTAVREVLEELSQAPAIIYGDEDELVCNGDGDEADKSASISSRRNPFFKPDFSPELFENFNYLGEPVLIRKDILEKTGISTEKFESEAPSSSELYEILKASVKQLPIASFDEKNVLKHYYKSVLHIPHILSHRISGSADEDCKKAIEKTVSNGAGFETSNSVSNSVSIIIPTKDHPDILRTCISSLMEKTDYDLEKIEIIVVDNGSATDNKAQNEELASKYSFKYIYDPQPFNYSRMNNLGIKKATGELVLLLNDDTEIIQKDWLAKMVYYAAKPEVGAVGAKLLYAGTD
ncbi:MAG: glycosyltransferase, partial [Lachnospiraceae bacterium]|nr:glycosyltransferase [Lachnospiraceae bacterium]